MKKILSTIAVGAFLLTPMSLKAEDASSKQAATGFFLGGHAGYNYMGTKMDATSNVGGVAGGLISTQKKHKSFNMSYCFDKRFDHFILT